MDTTTYLRMIIPVFAKQDDGGWKDSSIEFRIGTLDGWMPTFFVDGRKYAIQSGHFEALACAVLGTRDFDHSKLVELATNPDGIQLTPVLVDEKGRSVEDD